MCRIAVVSPGWEQYDLARVFEYLELSNGGDGNGVWTMDGMVKKSLKLTPAMAAKHIAGVGGVFHTRLRSTGKVTDDALHPHAVGDGSFIVQNGTWSSWSSYALTTKPDTDTQAIAELVNEYGPDALASTQLSAAGVFIWMKHGEPIRVYKNEKRPFGLHLFDDGRWMYASEDIGELLADPGVFYSIADKTYFEIDKNGMPRRLSPKSVTFSWKRSSTYYGGRVYTGGTTTTYAGGGVGGRARSCEGDTCSSSAPRSSRHGTIRDGANIARSIHRTGVPLDWDEINAIEEAMMGGW